MIEFPCPHCSVNISAEPEHAGATASCPTCGQDLVVPVSSVEGRADLQQPVAPSAAGNLPLVRGLHKKSAPRPSKKMVMLGVLALAAFSIIGVITMAKPTGRKSGNTSSSENVKKEETINLTTVGGSLEDSANLAYSVSDSVIARMKRIYPELSTNEIKSMVEKLTGISVNSKEKARKASSMMNNLLDTMEATGHNMR
jgi:hypothetical protein